MPVPSRSNLNKAEAKYNVTTDFPSLGLHSAASTGNVGLVEYALSHGQPVNSVVDGVLPLHAACAGGNVQVVKTLIDHGADVNGPRLPRKYSTEKNRDTSTPIVGTTGSTPLHFAAANGNTEVVSLLLLHGAHADRADKHGITPEMLAHQNGWIQCAQVLRDWALNKDKDLRERQGFDYQNTLDTSSSPIPSSRRRLNVKRSMDTALSMLRTTDVPRKPTQGSSPGVSPFKPADDDYFPTGDPSNFPYDLNARRPSLPQVIPPQFSNSDFNRNRKPSPTTPRRPRSAGTGAERKPQEVNYPTYGRGGAGRKLTTKYSLVNVFKRAQSCEDDGSAQDYDFNRSQERVALGSSTAPGSTTTLPLPKSFSFSEVSSTPNLPDTANQPATAPPRSGFPQHSPIQHHSHTSTSLTSPRKDPPQPPPSYPASHSVPAKSPARPSNIPLAVELHLALAEQQRKGLSSPARVSIPLVHGDSGDNQYQALPVPKINPLVQQHNRNRSTSSGIAPHPDRTLSQEVFQHNSNGYTTDDPRFNASPSPRPGILRAHNRSSSGGQGSPLPARTLRFDSTSSVPANERKGKESPRPISRPLPQPHQPHNLSPLTRLKIPVKEEDPVSPISDTEHNISVQEPSIEGELEDNEDDNYGHLIDQDPSTLPSVLLQRQRGLSFGSDCSLSPIDSVTDDAFGNFKSDFPFSIEQPPEIAPTEPIELSSPSQHHLNVSISPNGRGRGDSLSSVESEAQRALSSSGSATSMTISTPNYPGVALPLPSTKSLGAVLQADSSSPLGQEDHTQSLFPLVSSHSSPRPSPKRREHTPVDIDIAAISSHAQAEALVQKTRQHVLDLAAAQEVSALANTGRTPLSAKLAAYGESLALEKKLREQKEVEDVDRPLVSPPLAQLPNSVIPKQKNREGVERQHSLLEYRIPPRVKKRKDPRRPSTAEGVMSTRQSDTFTGDRPSPGHHSWRSATLINQQPQTLIPEFGNSSHYHFQESEPTSRTDSPSRPQPPRGISNGHPPPIAPELALSRVSSADPDTEPETINRGTSTPDPMKSVKKLARMGYPVEATTSTRTLPPAQPQKQRFGASIKSLMQTIRGKSN
ncbi:hypothetical protein CPB83DRAFT_906765 [Crepidotus variabilis]|uniref:Uncharacterized protein n=1 Tax=Crepidotus variabilis TaxID=179855 RepID=A0A9P6JQ44_9AGAR|nr:hypothetical protein CPB83DRAFT_906765 [Crepidotus variabilis]